MRESKLDEPFKVSRLGTEGRSAWREKLLFGGNCGDMVAIRPCDEQYKDQTYLGVLIGEIAQCVVFGADRNREMLTYEMALYNPAIFVPDLNTVIFGNASWWGRIKDIDQLREITNEDISNVWYIKALNQIANVESASTRSPINGNDNDEDVDA